MTYSFRVHIFCRPRFNDCDFRLKVQVMFVPCSTSASKIFVWHIISTHWIRNGNGIPSCYIVKAWRYFLFHSLSLARTPSPRDGVKIKIYYNIILYLFEILSEAIQYTLFIYKEYIGGRSYITGVYRYNVLNICLET